MPAFVVCIAVVLYRYRRLDGGREHRDDAPHFAVEIERRPASGAEVATARVMPVAELHDWMVEAATGIQRVLDRKPSQTSQFALRFFRTPVVQRIYGRWQNEKPFPTLAQFIALCQAFSPGRRFARFDAGACAAAVRTLEILAPSDPPAGRVLVDIKERAFYFVSPRSA